MRLVFYPFRSLLILFVSFLAVLAHGETINVYLIGGQSNADGRAKTSGLSASLQAPQTDVPFYYGNTEFSSNGLISLQPGTSEKKMNSTRGFGPEVTFGRSMADFYAPKGQSVALLKYAAGGTNLYSNWKAGGDATTTGDGAFYANFQSTINAGLAALQAVHPTATLLISGMLWVQGESDIDASTAGTTPSPVANYAANLTALINDLRATYSATLPFLFSQISSNQTVYSTSGDPDFQNYQTLRAQQALVASSLANTYMINTDGSLFTTTDPIANPGLHYDANGEKALGNAFAAQAQLLAPEPSSILLLIGVGGWAACRRRRFARNHSPARAFAGVAGSASFRACSISFRNSWR